MPESGASQPTRRELSGALVRAGDVLLWCFGALLYPAASLVVIAWKRELPRRVPSLGFLVRGTRFRGARFLTADWIGQHFRLVERNAPWLSLSFEETSDFCATSLQSRQLVQIPRDPPSVACHRIVTRFYTVEGSARARLSDVRTALLAAGWGRPDLDPFSRAERASQQREWVRTISWQPTPGFDTPGGLHDSAPFGASPISMHMQVDWSEHGTLGDITFPFQRVGVERSRKPSALYEPIEMGQARVGDSRPGRRSSAQADRARTSEIAITIDVEYYKNMNVNRRPGWIPKRMIPVIQSRL